MKNEEKDIIERGLSKLVPPVKDTIIIAPHPDDEIIGCYDQLMSENPTIVIYSGDLDANRREEALGLKEHVDIKLQLFLMNVPQALLNTRNTYYFPDPIYELHPLHRQWGTLGEQLARVGFDIVFYSTNMNSPYIHEAQYPDKKRDLLDKVYPNQKDLWKYDHKYFLFEGKCKWIF